MHVCKNNIHYDTYTEIICNSYICCFVRSLPSEIPRAFYNHNMKSIYNKILIKWNIPKEIIDIFIQYNPLYNYSNIFTFNCGNTIYNYTPGYLCNCSDCGIDRLFDQLK